MIYGEDETEVTWHFQESHTSLTILAERNGKMARKRFKFDPHTATVTLRPAELIEALRWLCDQTAWDEDR